MQIKSRNHVKARGRRVVDDVRRARQLGPVPDPVCCVDCPDYRPATKCHRYCQSAAIHLSSEGVNAPVELLVAPLVFELKKLGVFHPCWSCEGHNDATGQLRKLPAVWFYADSVIDLRSLSEAADRMFHRGMLAARWQIVLTHSDSDNPDVTFTLQPAPMDQPLSLDNLQRDLRVLADNIALEFRAACEKLEHAFS